MKQVDFFEKFYVEALENPTTITKPIMAVWAHKDGRCLAMTGVTSHVISAVPAGFVRNRVTLDEEGQVDIFAPEQK